MGTGTANIVRQMYIHNLARTMMGQFKIPPCDLDFGEREIPEELFRGYGSSLEARLAQFSDETLGKIAASGLSLDDNNSRGNTPLFSVRGEWDLKWKEGGRKLLLQIATVTVIAAMTDIVQSSNKIGKSA